MATSPPGLDHLHLLDFRTRVMQMVDSLMPNFIFNQCLFLYVVSGVTTLEHSIFSQEKNLIGQVCVSLFFKTGLVKMEKKRL
jgi:hypothetical protein